MFVEGFENENFNVNVTVAPGYEGTTDMVFTFTARDAATEDDIFPSSLTGWNFGGEQVIRLDVVR